MTLWSLFLGNLQARWFEFSTRHDLYAEQLRRVIR